MTKDLKEQCENMKVIAYYGLSPFVQAVLEKQKVLCQMNDDGYWEVFEKGRDREFVFKPNGVYRLPTREEKDNVRVNKITEGYVTQTFDKRGKLIGQFFTSFLRTGYKTEKGETSFDHGFDAKFDMVQPKKGKTC